MSGVIHVLTGCTAVGKTELALSWAEANNAEIISCDSLLFYRGMDIGTAKPSKAELARVPHHLIDICDVMDQMDITRYVAMALAATGEIFSRGRRILVTGGSGFYLKAFLAPVADEIEVEPELRNDVRRRLEKEGPAELVEELHRLNPAGLGALDVQNPRRVARALERCLASGKTLAALKANFETRPSPFAKYEVRLCELTRDKSELEARIDQRIAAMLQAGLVNEVTNLLAVELRKNPSAANAIGYRETIEFVEGTLEPGDLAARIGKNTKALVKKQRTWFKTQLPTHRQVDAARAKLDELFE